MKTQQELLSTEFGPRSWAVRDLIPRGGAVLIAGKLKEGKSWLALLAAVSVTEGTPFLDRFPVDQGDVLYLALEDDDQRMQERLKKLLDARQAQREQAKRDAPEDEEDSRPERPNGRLYITTEWETAEEGGLQKLDDWLTDTPDVRMVVIDIMECFDPIRRGYHSAGATIRKLGKLGEKHDVAMVAVMHMYRGTIGANNSDWTDKIQGGIGAPSAAQAIIGLSRPRGSDEGILRATGKDVPELAMGLKWESGIFSASDGIPPSNESNLTAKQAIVESMVGKHGWGLDPNSEAPQLAPVGVKAADAAELIKRETGDPSDEWNYENTRQLMHQMAKSKRLENIDKRYFTPMQAVLLRTWQESQPAAPVEAEASPVALVA